MNTIPPPITTKAANSCSGITSEPPLPDTHYLYNVTLNNITFPLDATITIPKFDLFIPLAKIFNVKIPKINSICETPRRDMLSYVPCGGDVVIKKVCFKIRPFKRKRCVNIPTPIVKVKSVYLDDDLPATVKLFTLPEIGLILKGTSSPTFQMSFGLTTNFPIEWSSFLVAEGILKNTTSDKKAIFDALVAVKKSLAPILSMLARSYLEKKIYLSLSVKITRLVMDITWNVDYLKLYIGNQIVELKNVSYTFKNVDIIQLSGLDAISFTLKTPDKMTINFVVGTYKLNTNPYVVVLSMINDSINRINEYAKSHTLSEIQKNELVTLKKALEIMGYLNNPALNIVEELKLLRVNPPNFMKQFLDLTAFNVVVSLKVCPLQGTTAVCASVVFDITEYINSIGDYLRNGAKDAIDEFDKYDKFDIDSLPFPTGELARWNDLYEKANDQVTEIASIALDTAADVLTDQSQSYDSSITFCAPI
jgi:hypothetical protein